MKQKILQHHFKNAMLRMDTGAPGAIGALIATFGAARYVAGCLGRGGRAIGDWTPGRSVESSRCPSNFLFRCSIDVVVW